MRKLICWLAHSSTLLKTGDPFFTSRLSSKHYNTSFLRSWPISEKHDLPCSSFILLYSLICTKYIPVVRLKLVERCSPWVERSVCGATLGHYVRARHASCSTAYDYFHCARRSLPWTFPFVHSQLFGPSIQFIINLITMNSLPLSFTVN